MASPESENAEKQFLYADRLIDDRGNQDIRWLFDKDQTCMAPKPPNTAVLVLRRRICGCDKCAPYSKLFEGSVSIGEGQGPWEKAPSKVELTSVSWVDMLLRDKTGTRIRFPIEFTEVKSPKIITLSCKQDLLAHGKRFEDFSECYRFRTDHPSVEVAFFWADKRAQITRVGDTFSIKLVMKFVESFDAKPGDTVRIILERRADAAGNFRDIACLADAVTFCSLSDIPMLNRFFGRPEWEVGDVGLFVDRDNELAVFRMTKERRDQIRQFLDKGPVTLSGVAVSREIALVLVLLLLWYIDKEWGDQLDEFFASPFEFINKKLEEWKGKVMKDGREELLRPLDDIKRSHEKRLKRTAYGAVLGTMAPETRGEWIALRHTGKALLGRAVTIMEILDRIQRGLLWVVEGIRIQRFLESVFRPDTIYSTQEQFFFVSFTLDKETCAPNGLVCTNLIPLGPGGFVAAAYSAGVNQVLFWESADAYWLELLNVDKHVRGMAAARAKSDAEGKTVCRLCGQETLPGLLGGERPCDRVCKVCGQRYHSGCLYRIVNTDDCPRCMQKRVIVEL